MLPSVLRFRQNQNDRKITSAYRFLHRAEKTKTSKADLVAAVKDAVAYCNKTFDGMTDAKGSQMVKLLNFQLAKLTVLSFNTAHTDEHYENMVTYLRLKGILPPTSENAPAPRPK